MAIRLDYLEQIDDHGEEMKYCDLVLEGHAKWVSTDRGPAQPVPTGNLLGVVSIREGRYELRLSDDEFTLVDGKISILAVRLREIVELEYQSLFRGRYWSLTQEEKWRKLGLKRTEYSIRLTGAKCALHQLLLPHIVTWRLRGQANRD